MGAGGVMEHHPKGKCVWSTQACSWPWCQLPFPNPRSSPDITSIICPAAYHRATRRGIPVRVLRWTTPYRQYPVQRVRDCVCGRGVGRLRGSALRSSWAPGSVGSGQDSPEPLVFYLSRRGSVLCQLNSNKCPWRGSHYGYTYETHLANLHTPARRRSRPNPRNNLRRKRLGSQAPCKRGNGLSIWNRTAIKLTPKYRTHFHHGWQRHNCGSPYRKPLVRSRQKPYNHYPCTHYETKDKLLLTVLNLEHYFSRC